MDHRPLLHLSPPSPEETPASAHYEPLPSHLASSSPRSASAPNVPLRPPSTPPPSPRVSSSPPSASAAGELRTPSSPLEFPCIKIEGTSGDKVQTGGATANATGHHTISDEPLTQDHTLSLSGPSSTSPTISPSPLPPGAVAGASPSTLWLPMRSPTLPLTNPRPVRHSIFTQFKKWHKSCQGHLLPDGVIQVRIAVCGFAFYGIMALLGNTWDLVKEFSENCKVLVLFFIGFIWTIATVAVPINMSARTRLDKALSQHATRLVLLRITLHMLLNISLMLPRDVLVASKMNLWSLVALVFLLVLAIIGHGVSWIQS